MRVLKTLLFLIFLSQKLIAQYSSVYLPYPSGACVNTQYQVTVYPSGFANGTTVSILLSNDDFSTSTTIGSSIYNGQYSLPINCLIPNGLTQGNNYKVKASAPGVPAANNYPSTTFSIATSVPSASMTGNLGLNACNGNVNLPIAITGYGPFEYSYHRTGDFYDVTRSGILSNTPTETVYSAGEYTLLSVGNACGTGTVAAAPNNVANVTVTPPVLTIGAPADDRVCIGNKMKVPFTSDQACYNYIIQISDNTGSNFQDATTEYDQFGDPGNLIVLIPGFVSPGSGYKLRVKVNTSNGTFYSIPISGTITILAKPSILGISALNPNELNYPGIIAKGESVTINTKLSGTPPFSIKIGDEWIQTSIDSILFQVSPQQDKRITFGPLQDNTGCISNQISYFDTEPKDYIFKLRITESHNLDIFSQFRNFCRNEYIFLNFDTRSSQPQDSVFVQMANYIDYNAGKEEWINAPFEKEGDHLLRVKIPSVLKKGRNMIRMVPRNPNHTFFNHSYNQINDAIVPSTDFILMDGVTGSITNDQTLYIAPNEPFHIFYKFSGGPEYYNLGELKAFKPSLKTSYGQFIEYNYLNPNGPGFASTIGQTRVDTVTKTMFYKLENVTASTAATDLTCNSQSQFYRDTLRVNVIPPDLTRSISTGVISGSSNLCGGSQIVVPFTTTGSFNGLNQFIVQIQGFNNTYDNKPFTNYYNATTSAGPAPGQLTLTLPQELESTYDTYYKVRVVSTDPMVIGSTSTSWIQISGRKPLVKLFGQAYVQAGEKAKIFVSTNNNPGFNFTITNGTDYTSPTLYSYSFGLSSDYQYEVNTSPEATVGSTITYTSVINPNTCGAGVSSNSNQVHIVANPMLTISNLTGNTGCSPSKIAFDFTSSLTFSNENTFSVRVWHNYYGSPTYVSNVSVRKVGNKFIVEFPNTSVPLANTTYYLKIFSSAPYAYSNSLSFALNPSPSYGYNPYTENVESGGTINLNYSFYGVGPFTYEISTHDKTLTGNTISSSVSLNLQPAFSMVYALKNMSDANCTSTLLNTGPSITVLEKKQSIEIVRLPFTGICPGVSISVPFISSGSFSSFVLQISDQNGSNFVDMATTQSSGNLSATIPLGLAAGGNYKIRIKGFLTGGGEAFSLPTDFGMTLKGTVSATISGSTELVKNTEFPSYFNDKANLRIDFTGVGPYTFSLFDGTNTFQYTTESSPHFIPVKPAVTTTYSLTNVQNSCGNGSVSGSATVNVVMLQTGDPGTQFLCYGQTLTIPFTPTGTFNPASQYYIDFIKITPYNNTFSLASTYQTLFASKSGNTLSVVIPPGFPTTTGLSLLGISNYYKLRVRSTMPEVLGSFFNLGIGIGGGAPTIKILGSTNIATAGIPTPLTLVSSNAAGETAVTLNNGSTNETIYMGGSSLEFNKAPSVTTTYTITAINSQCGTGTIGSPASATITVGPCPASQMVSLDHISGQTKKYETSGILTAINKISSGANITFDAQHAVVLSPGFTANSGSIFKVQIDGCGGL
ncbi:MAG: hypothetical protein LCH67_18370 [Bacteroidetes bacterium]|nr:hypothetical protein [Bacteroidota bacterium]